MKFWALLSLLFLVSCLNGKDSGKPEKNEDPIGTCLCLDVPEWSVTSKRPFPKNFQILFENVEIVNTCKGAKPGATQKPNGIYEIKFQSAEFPEEFFNFEITDLGVDCSLHDAFYSGSPMYSTAIIEQPEIKYTQHQVYVNLDQ